MMWGITALIMWVFFLMSNIKFETLMQRWGNANLRCKMLISNNLDHAACVTLPRWCRHRFDGQVSVSHWCINSQKPFFTYFLIRGVKISDTVGYVRVTASGSWRRVLNLAACCNAVDLKHSHHLPPLGPNGFCSSASDQEALACYYLRMSPNKTIIWEKVCVRRLLTNKWVGQ